MIDTLLASHEPSIRWKVRTRVLDEAPDSPAIVALRQEIRGSERVRRLLAPSSSESWPGAYAKRQGARAAPEIALHHDSVWGGTSTRRANPWVTATALAVLHAAGRVVR